MTGDFGQHNYISESQHSTDNIRPLVSCQMLLGKDIMFLTDVNTNSRIGSQDGSDIVIRFFVCVCVKIVL